MIVGMTPLTLFHVLLSFVGIGSGLWLVATWLMDQRREGLTQLFLISTLATTVTGFLFPVVAFTPALGVGIVSMIVLGAAIAARYIWRLVGFWRPVYILAALCALYLNVFVLVVQAFEKVPVLNALAPTGTEQPLALTQGLVLVGFIVAGVLSVRRFHPLPA